MKTTQENAFDVVNPVQVPVVVPVDGFNSNALTVNRNYRVCQCPYGCIGKRFLFSKLCLDCILIRCLQGGHEA